MLKPLQQHELDLDSTDTQVDSPVQAHSIMGSNPVSVCCRLKPILLNQEKANIHINMKQHAIIISQDLKQITKTFAFDQIFDQTVCQHKFTKTICDPLIQFLKNDGNGGLIFSYGVTNSGKTHSILGNIENPGVLYYLIKKLEDQFGNGSVKITAFQLYNDEFYSLKNKEKMTPKQFCGFLQFDDYEPDTILAQNMETILKQYMANRSEGDTKFNPKSSRSHAIFKIECKNFKIGVVDLAGSQRSKAGVGQKMIQTISINKSLLLLGRCIQALKDKKKNPNVRIPFRESKLTQVLMEYFTTGFKIRIIANINQAKSFYFENIQVLQYTSIAKNITNNCSSQFAQAVKSARKKYELIKSNFKSQKQKSLKKSQYKAKVKIDEQEIIIDEETFVENSHRDTELRRILILSEKAKIQQQEGKKEIDMSKANQIVEDIHATQRAFSIFLDFQHQKQAEQDRKFLSQLKKVNFFQSQKKNDKFTQTGINTINDNSYFFQCDIKKLKTEAKNKLRAQFQSERKRLNQNQEKEIQTCQSQKKEFSTPKKQTETQEQQNSEYLDEIMVQNLENNVIAEVSNQTQLSKEDQNFFIKSIYKPTKDLFESGVKQIANVFNHSMKKAKMIFKSNVKQRKTMMKARNFGCYPMFQIKIQNYKNQQIQQVQVNNQEIRYPQIEQIEFKEVNENQNQNQIKENEAKQFCDQAISVKVEMKNALTQTCDFQPQKPVIKFKVPLESQKKNQSIKKIYQKSVEKKPLLKNKTPLKYIPPTPVAKRTRHIRRKYN